jgi:hypothetical protein
MVAQSSREVDMEEAIVKYEFSTINRTLMQPDGYLHPTTDESKVITILENMPPKFEPCHQKSYQDTSHTNACLIVDRMAVVQELMAVKSFENCTTLSNAYVGIINAKSRNYQVTRVVFDNYSFGGSLKEATRARRRGSTAPVKGYKVEDTTRIKDAKYFLGSTSTKDELTHYLAQQLVDKADVDIITATNEGVMSNKPGYISPGVSSQEEADTLMILHAVEAAKAGFVIHIYSQNTDVLLLALRRVPLLGDNAAMLMGMCDRRRLVMLQPIYNALGEDKANALCK